MTSMPPPRSFTPGGRDVCIAEVIGAPFKSQGGVTCGPASFMTAIRRLALCLDGTWNNRDDSTNVLHHFGLATECRDHPLGNDTVTQLKFYLEGVGTGPLDKITGGGFGFGLETNVRAAYNWLVQNFEDANGLQAADEIYIFGFSRGAFTARSLVGFISTCGLLRRGAPLTVNELWQNYCLLGREREHHSGPLTDLFGDPAPSSGVSPISCGIRGRSAETKSRPRSAPLGCRVSVSTT